MREFRAILCGEELPEIMLRGCQDPACKRCKKGPHETDELVLGQRCHPEAGVKVTLMTKDHAENPLTRPILAIACVECNAPVVAVLVGFEDESTS